MSLYYLNTAYILSGIIKTIANENQVQFIILIIILIDCYAMFSIGILGFLVWSCLMGLCYSDIVVLNFTLSQKIVLSISTLLNSHFLVIFYVYNLILL